VKKGSGNLIQTLKNLSHVLFPQLCLSCRQNATSKSSAFCTMCIVDLPWTDHFGQKVNKAAAHFWGRIELEYVASLLYMREDSDVQNMIHGIKYKGRSNDARILGALLGQKIMESQKFPPIDILVPIPITKAKKAYRGYNQAELIASGINEVLLSTRVDTTNLIKVKENQSQTGKSRIDRVSNVSNTYMIKNPKAWQGLHVLIVDDVITTGATIESCCLKMVDAKVESISVVSIATAIS
jgi:ComF family protein